MVILTEKDIDGTCARELRKRLGMTQPDFWGAVGLTQSGGCRYEKGGSIPRPYRILIFLVHVARLTIDVTSKEGAGATIALAELQKDQAAAAGLSDAIQRVQKAQRALAEAGAALAT
ncbi:DNA-binding transcriptional regulator [Paraburkholderia terrae]|uniref:helix-turn-helix domain-containing protein n=1 Tax=Paraburkholderia terrae TaxID=311230 RepID=UPI001EE1C77B|nr:helix-turn-helix transcriptional regulator [Paraburkholderia terrae]GJH00258.1 helix-turn-helix transcriptional regulator [Paraburkholderia terrae]